MVLFPNFNCGYSQSWNLPFSKETLFRTLQEFECPYPTSANAIQFYSYQQER